MASILAVCQPGALPDGWRSVFRGVRAPHRLIAETPDGDEAVELCGRMATASQAVGRPVPIVALAPRLDDEERAELLAAGATGYVLTTIDAASLAVALEAIAEVAGVAGGGANGGAGEEPPADVRVRPDDLLDDRAVDDARRELVLGLAGDRARVAARALAQVDDHHPLPVADRFLHRPGDLPLHPQEVALALGLRRESG